jgi:para-nitrobenzyl esterase
MVAPSNAGLFHRAISESGGCTTVQPTRAQAEAAAVSLATSLGCTGAGALACLRGKSVDSLVVMNASSRLGLEVDTQFIPDQPRTLYDTGKIAKVPYLLGSNTDEGTLFLPATKPASEADYMTALTAIFGATVAPQVAAAYPVSAFAAGVPNPPTAALARVIGDSRLVCTTFDTAVRTSRAGASVYLYNFDVPVPALIPTAAALGATHGSELTSVFGTSPTFATDPGARSVSDLMQRYWTNFAKTGNPNAGADLGWSAFTENQNVRINFARQPSIVTDFRATECAFWRAGYAMQFPAQP